MDCKSAGNLFCLFNSVVFTRRKIISLMITIVYPDHASGFLFSQVIQFSQSTSTIAGESMILIHNDTYKRNSLSPAERSGVKVKN